MLLTKLLAPLLLAVATNGKHTMTRRARVLRVFLTHRVSSDWLPIRCGHRLFHFGEVSFIPLLAKRVVMFFNPLLVGGYAQDTRAGSQSAIPSESTHYCWSKGRMV